MFAADNELPSRDWLSRAAFLFLKEEELAAAWGRIIASNDDPLINKYYALIQNDPLTFFVNKNLSSYLKSARIITEPCAYIFRVDPKFPLPWGANGLVYRTTAIHESWAVDGYMGDNDAFQLMIGRGKNLVGYSPELEVIHHSISSLRDWRSKFKRNFGKHFIAHYGERELGWAFPADFNRRFLMWLAYAILPVFSLAHGCYLAFRDRNPLWLYHPFANLIQVVAYLEVFISNREARNVVYQVLHRGI